MKRTPKQKKPVSAETIARLTDKGKDVSRFSLTRAIDAPDPAGQCRLLLANVGRTGQRGKGTEHQPTGSNQNVDPTGAGPALSGNPPACSEGAVGRTWCSTESRRR